MMAAAKCKAKVWRGGKPIYDLPRLVRCGKPVYGRGSEKGNRLCLKHYKRVRKDIISEMKWAAAQQAKWGKKFDRLDKELARFPAGEDW
jgi:hypothetical protein